MSSKAEQILAGLGGADEHRRDRAVHHPPAHRGQGRGARRRGGAQGRRRPRRRAVRHRGPGRRRPRGRQPRRGHRGPDVTGHRVTSRSSPRAPGGRSDGRRPRPGVRHRDGGPGGRDRPRNRARRPSVSPIAGKLVKIHPHAFVVLGSDGVGVLVHLGINTVRLEGKGSRCWPARATRSRPAPRWSAGTPRRSPATASRPRCRWSPWTGPRARCPTRRPGT